MVSQQYVLLTKADGADRYCRALKQILICLWIAACLLDSLWVGEGSPLAVLKLIELFMSNESHKDSIYMDAQSLRKSCSRASRVAGCTDRGVVLPSNYGPAVVVAVLVSDGLVHCSSESSIVCSDGRSLSISNASSSSFNGSSTSRSGASESKKKAFS
jgi:hypothetical protein